MGTNFFQRLAINDDVSAEFDYWKSKLLLSVWIAAGFVVATGAAIALWPQGSGNVEVRTFVRDFWTLFVECAFWFGLLLGLLWGAAKRLGSGLSGTLPWQPLHRLSRRAATARFFGQCAASFALASVFLWIAQQFALLAGPSMAEILIDLTQLMHACLGFAAVFALAAIIGRDGSTSPRHSFADHDKLR